MLSTKGFFVLEEISYYQTKAWTPTNKDSSPAHSGQSTEDGDFFVLQCSIPFEVYSSGITTTFSNCSNISNPYLCTTIFS